VGRSSSIRAEPGKQQSAFLDLRYAGPKGCAPDPRRAWRPATLRWRRGACRAGVPKDRVREQPCGEHL